MPGDVNAVVEQITDVEAPLVGDEQRRLIVAGALARLSGLDTIDGIGSTENYHIFLSNSPGDTRPGSSGKPFEGYELRLVDDDGDDVPQGEVGNLWVKGETAALAYLHPFLAEQGIDYKIYVVSQVNAKSPKLSIGNSQQLFSF